MGTENKVKYNLKNVHYAPLTVGADGTLTFGTPKHIPGAVSMSLSAEGETTPFYADGIAYYIATANNGYSGDVEMALIPDSFRKDILGEVEDARDKVLMEYSNVETKPFAWLFEFDGDQQSTRHVLYNCTATRPNIEGETISGSKEPKTETLSLTATMLSDGRVKAKTTADTMSQAYQNWFKSVWEPSPAPTAEGV